MKIYDSKLKKKVEFEPIEEGKIGMYVCGPTVYDKAHLGHGRSAVSFDVIRRYFEYRGFQVKYVSNYTDIDDKMINRAKEEGCSVAELAARVIPMYEDDYGKLGVKKADVQPRATEFIDTNIEIIKRLDDEGYVYLLEDGVYFDVKRFKAYGGLSGQNLSDLQAGARVEVDPNKRSPFDFVLWKFKKEGEPSWASPWGEGRPGWHIECSSMTWKCLGEKFDIHGGGLDLKFPHHECEVAQSVGAFGEGSFAKYWMHNGFINVDNEKMSKSLNNFKTLRDIFEKFDPKVVRLMFLQTHYRNPINFSEDLLEQAKSALQRIHDFVRNLEDSNGDDDFSVAEFRDQFRQAMDDDFDSSGALAAVFDMIKLVNKLNLSKKAAERVMDFVDELDQVLAVLRPEIQDLSAEINDLILKRKKAREEKDFAKADKIRDELLKQGIVVEDTPNGVIWKRLS